MEFNIALNYSGRAEIVDAARRDRRGRSPARGGRRAAVQRLPVHGGPAGSGSAHPHERRDAREQLPAVADRLRRESGSPRRCGPISVAGTSSRRSSPTRSAIGATAASHPPVSPWARSEQARPRPAHHARLLSALVLLPAVAGAVWYRSTRSCAVLAVAGAVVVLAFRRVRGAGRTARMRSAGRGGRGRGAGRVRRRRLAPGAAVAFTLFAALGPRLPRSPPRGRQFRGAAWPASAGRRFSESLARAPVGMLVAAAWRSPVRGPALAVSRGRVIASDTGPVLLRGRPRGRTGARRLDQPREDRRGRHRRPGRPGVVAMLRRRAVALGRRRHRRARRARRCARGARHYSGDPLRVARQARGRRDKGQLEC